MNPTSTSGEWADEGVRMPARERQVLDLAAQGMTDKEISRELGISRDTVGTYWRRILGRFGAASRTEVVARTSQMHARRLLDEHQHENERLLQEIAARSGVEAELLSQRNLMEALAAASMGLLAAETQVRAVFDQLLADLLSHTHAQLGFISEVTAGEAAATIVRVLAITDIAWDDASREAIRHHQTCGMRLPCEGNLLGDAVRYRTHVIANDVPHDPRSRGLPAGHPPVTNFLGLPVFNGSELVGMVGLSNRRGGFDAALVERLGPLLALLGQLIGSVRVRTAHDEAEARVRAAAVRLRAVFDRLNDGLLLEDAHRRVHLANRPMVGMFDPEADPEAIVGADCRLLAGAAAPFFEDPEGFIARVEQLMADQVSSAVDWMRFADGRLAQRTFVRIGEGDVLHGFLWRYVVYPAPSELAEGLRPWLEAVPGPVWLLDPLGRVAARNAAAARVGRDPHPAGGGGFQWEDGSADGLKADALASVPGIGWMVRQI